MPRKSCLEAITLISDLFRIVVPAVVFSTLLSGCVSTLIGGVQESDSSVTIDNNTVDRQLKKSLATARKLTFLGTKNEADLVYMAKHLELEGDYEVNIVTVSSLGSPSQTRKRAQKECRNRDKPDLVFSSSHGETKTGSTFKGVLTGRAEAEMNGTVNVLRCRDGWKSKFAVSVHLNEGIYSSDKVLLNQSLGIAYAEALLSLAGPAGDAIAGNNGQNLVKAIQSELAKIGYYQGVVDGIYGPNTKKAISIYQSNEGLSVTGVPTPELLAQLKGA